MHVEDKDWKCTNQWSPEIFLKEGNTGEEKIAIKITGTDDIEKQVGLNIISKRCLKASKREQPDKKKKDK